MLISKWNTTPLLHLWVMYIWCPQNVRIFWRPPPCLHWATDLYYKIHATSLTLSAFWDAPPSADIIFTCPLIKPDILLWHCSPYQTIYLPVLWATPSSWSRTPRPTRPWRSLPPKRTWPSRPSWRAARGRRPPRCRTHHRLRRHPHHCSRRRGTLLVFNRIVAKNRFSARPRTVG